MREALKKLFGIKSDPKPSTLEDQKSFDDLCRQFVRAWNESTGWGAASEVQFINHKLLFVRDGLPVICELNSDNRDDVMSRHYKAPGQIGIGIGHEDRIKFEKTLRDDIQRMMHS